MGALALKDARMELKTAKEAKEVLSKAAVLGSMNLSSFMRSTAMEKAREILLDHASIQLSVQGQAQLAVVLQKPVAPTCYVPRRSGRTVPTYSRVKLGRLSRGV